MLIYCYADILGYRSLLRTHTASEVGKILDGAMAQMHGMLDGYVRDEAVIKKYQHALGDSNNAVELFFDYLKGEENGYTELRNAILQKAESLVLKTYVAFDTIVLYWDEFEPTKDHLVVFLLATELLYLCLYARGIVLRGAVTTCEDYRIDDVGNDRLFIVGNIDAAAEVEKNQNWGNIIVFGKDIIHLSDRSLGSLTEDLCVWLDLPGHPESQDHYLTKAPGRTPPFKDKFVDRVLNGTAAMSSEDLFIDRRYRSGYWDVSVKAISPVNSFILNALGVDVFTELYRSTSQVLQRGYQKNNHAEELLYRTAAFLHDLLESRMHNAYSIQQHGLSPGGNLPDAAADLRELWFELAQKTGYLR